jgi:hypothetical protein
MVMRLLLVILAAACGTQVDAKVPEPDPCGLPTGIDIADLDTPVANLMMRRALICNDHRFGRIDDEQYRRLTAALDAELAGKPIKKTRAPQKVLSTRLIVWASSVIDFSTQYTENAWSANQIVGAPDVYPAYGDHNKAWASRGADDREEFIEVGFERPERVSGVEIYETFNPGAIDKIELITVKGRRIEVSIGGGPPAPGVSAHSVFDVRCTQDPIASVRVHLDSQRVSGWNELDAIGVVPCTR